MSSVLPPTAISDERGAPDLVVPVCPARRKSPEISWEAGTEHRGYLKKKKNDVHGGD
jgi:hypothetical protein